jgi:enoyl-[acyl-carrier protein] reductase II
MKNEITQMLGIHYPIIQAGMAWTSGWKLAAAAAEAGVLGVIGSATMETPLLIEHIRKAKAATDNPIAVNIPLLFSHTSTHLDAIIAEKVSIVITAAGNPKDHTPRLKDAGMTVIHVVSSDRQAVKAEEAGVDAVVCEGTEAGGHNGFYELTTMVLTPLVVKAVSIPVVAAGGIGDGRAMAAALALGAKGVQIGSRFAATQESSLHPQFKEEILKAGSRATKLLLKNIMPVRMIMNRYAQELKRLEESGASKEAIFEFMGRGRTRQGMFEGDLVEGELEIGQVAASISDLPKVSELVPRIVQDCEATIAELFKTFRIND